MDTSSTPPQSGRDEPLVADPQTTSSDAVNDSAGRPPAGAGEEPGTADSTAVLADTGDDSQSDETAGDAKKHTPWWKETILLVCTALVLALLIKTFFVQAFYIPSGSMESTLNVNDRILVEKVSYWFGSPQRGDIVVFKDPNDWLGLEGGSHPTNPLTRALSFVGLYPEGGHLVKRVIGVGGDHVRCHDGKVQVNGVNLDEASYVTLAPQACLGFWSVVVPKDHLWVLGDNRDNSADSRAHMNEAGGGFVPVSDVVGKVFVTVWPIDRWRFFHRPSTFNNPALDEAVGLVGTGVPMGVVVLGLIPPFYRRVRLRWGNPGLLVDDDGYDIPGPLFGRVPHDG